MTLRARLLAIVVLAMLPAAIAIGWHEWNLHDERESDVNQAALQHSRLLASEFSRLIEGSAQLLRTIGNAPAVRELTPQHFDPQHCTSVLNRMQLGLDGFATIVMLDTSGEVICGAGIGSQLGDRPFFLYAMQTGGFVVGEYADGRLSQKPLLQLALPVLDDAGERLGVLAAGVPLTWLQKQLSATELPAGTSVTLMDRNGVVLARIPAGAEHWIGRPAPDGWLHASGSGETLVAAGLDGEQRIFGFSPVTVDGTEVLHVGVGILAAPAIHAIHRRIYGELGIAATGVLLALLLAWLLADRTIRLPVNRLIGTVQAWSAGDLSARTAESERTDEIGRLAASFNAMGESLALRTYQLRSSQQNEESTAARLRVADRAMAASSAPMLLVDANLADQPITYVNPAFERETGYTAAESIGRNCRFLRADATDEQQRVLLREALQTSREQKVLLKNRRKDGTEFLCELHVAPVFDVAGHTTHFMGILNNVSARVRAEQAAEAATNLMLQLLESTTDAVIAINFQRRITYINERALDRVGDGREMIGVDLWELFPAEAEPFLQRYADVLANRVSDSFEAYYGPLASWFEIHAHPNDEGMAIFFRDITERKEHETQLIEAKEEALAASQAKSNFLATMSHELRTPLNAVIGFSEMIATGAVGPIDARYQEYGNDIRSSGMHLLRVINDVLDVSKIEAGRVELNDRNVHLRELAKSCADLLRANAAERRIQIALNSPDDIVVRVDPVRMRQAVLNLLSNAVKFSNTGGTVRIATYLSAKGAPCLSVTDSGIGMRPQDVEIALQPFRQLENAYARTYEGTGLGLPIASRLIELHGGDLQIESTFGRGTTIEVCLPVDRLVSVSRAWMSQEDADEAAPSQD